MDIDPERLEFSRKAVQSIVDRGNYPAKVVATMDRKEALKGAKGVVCTILNGGVEIWQHDILIPKKYGIDTNVGDTRSVSGIFRALRTIPVMVSIADDIEKLCPDAIFLNYTNPMAMLCRAMKKTHPDLLVSGLCHSVWGTAAMLAKWIGADMKDITYVSAGINHQSWYTQYKWNGKDAYPLIFKAVQNKKTYNEEVVRNEMFLHLGYYVTESSGHNSEYNWWFRKRPDLIKKYCNKGTGWNTGKYAFILDLYRDAAKNWKKEVKDWFAKGAPIELERSGEYASSIINAYLGGEMFKFNGNVPNTGLITNLPKDVCVEVPVLADKRGLNPIHVGALPPQCAALNNVSVAVEEMAVQAALDGDPRMLFHAVAYDPLSAAVLSLAEIQQMTSEMLKKNKAYLPQFKHLS
jgi:alpha-galactosidase